MLVNRPLRDALILVLICMVTFSVSAQEIEPTSTPRPTTTTILSEVSDAVDRMGIFNFVAAGLVVLVILVAWKGLQPLIQTGADATKRAADAQNAMLDMARQMMKWHDEQTNLQVKVEENRKSQTESLVKAAALMAEIETRNEAQQRTNLTIQQVNDHTTQAVAQVVNMVNQKLEVVESGLAQVQDDLKASVTQKAFKDGIQPIVDRLNIISGQVTDIHNRLANLTVPNVSSDVTITTEVDNKE